MPTLGSMPSFRNWIDTSPQVFYPSSKADDDRAAQRQARWEAEAAILAAGRGQIPPRAAVPPERRRGRGRARSHSMDAWNPSAMTPYGGAVPRQGLTSRSDTPTGLYRSTSHQPGHNDRAHTRPRPPSPPGAPRGSSERPTHRRSRSALPSPEPRPYWPSLRSRPTSDGYSRNSLAASSAVSLPTLIEVRMPEPDVTGSASFPTGMHARSRRLSSATTVSTSSLAPSSLRSVSTMPSPLSTSSLPLPLANDDDGGRFPSSVPPPQPQQVDRVITRPPHSPRAQSFQATSAPKTTTHRRGQSLMAVPASARLNGLDAPLRPSRPKPAKASISNVAVMAVWSFPAAKAGTLQRGQPDELAQPTPPRRPDTDRRLKDRLRDLSSLDTACSSGDHGSRPDEGHARHSDGKGPPDYFNRDHRATPGRFRPSHRHSYSSPDALAAVSARAMARQHGHSSSPLRPPGARPEAHLPQPMPIMYRPTALRRDTSKLRSPTPLSMPMSLPVHRASVPMSRHPKPLPFFNHPSHSVAEYPSAGTLSPMSSASASMSDLTLSRTDSGASTAADIIPPSSSSDSSPPHQRAGAWWKRWSTKPASKARDSTAPSSSASHQAGPQTRATDSHLKHLLPDEDATRPDFQPSSVNSEVYISFDDM